MLALIGLQRFSHFRVSNDTGNEGGTYTESEQLTEISERYEAEMTEHWHSDGGKFHLVSFDGSASSGGFGFAANRLSTCFTAGTQIVVGAEFDENDVFVRYVTQNIEDIKVGDLVYGNDDFSLSFGFSRYP